jgi:hypothetical protein
MLSEREIWKSHQAQKERRVGHPNLLRPNLLKDGEYAWVWLSLSTQVADDEEVRWQSAKISCMQPALEQNPSDRAADQTD